VAVTMLRRAGRLLTSRELRAHPVRAVGRRLRWRLHWRLRRQVPFVVPFYEGLELQLGHSSASLGVFLNDGFSDSSVSSLFIETLEPGMQVLDCGAHIGEYTLLFARLVGPTGWVHAFEPDPRMFPLLQANVERNGLRNVTLANVALSDREGTEWFAVRDDATASALQRFTDQPGANGVLIPTTTLDRYLERSGLQTVDAIKMDIEGAEAAAVAGAHRLLMTLRPALVFVECDRHDNTPVVERLLVDQGYRVTTRRDRAHLHPHVIARRGR
jgi:FkbM family methyltransferase